ncbi:hypothetical protein IAU59_002014 [Kwoniella sp. CBS 9459]
MATTSLILPLNLRLRTLEAQLFGVPSSLVDSADYRSSTKKAARTSYHDGDDDDQDGHQRAVIRRMRDIEDTFDRLAGQSDGLKRLLEGYKQYQPLLALPTTQPSTSSTTDQGEKPAASDHTANDEGETTTRSEGVISESDLLSDRVKLSMVLEAAADIRNAERDLREIELLSKKGVQGSGSLEDLLPYRPALINAVKETQIRTSELDKARRDVGRLLMRYNEFTNTTSELFVDVHHQLEYLEERVRALERKKKKELAERY